MIRQYFAQRTRGGDNPLRVGVVPVGAIFYLQHDGWWRDCYRGNPVCSDMAVVRSLRHGRRRHVAVRLLILHETEGLRRDPATYPDLPTSSTFQLCRRAA